MKPLVLTALAALLISALLREAVVSFVGRPGTVLPVEILQLPRTTFAGEAARGLFAAPSLAAAKDPLLIVLGASSAQEAYRPAPLQPLLPGWSVNNLAIGGANITENLQMLKLVRKVANPDLLKRSVVYLGLSYPLFVTNEKRWVNPHFVPPSVIASGVLVSDLERESMRYPLLPSPAGKIMDYTPAWLQTLCINRYAPWAKAASHVRVHLADDLVEWTGWKYDPRVLFPSKKKKKPKLPKVKPPKPPAPPFTARDQMDGLTQYMGAPMPLQDEQFQELELLIAECRAAGIKVVAGEMPLPSWHRQDSPYFKPSATRLRSAMEAAHIPLLDLSEAMADDEFRDSSHPKAESISRWSEVLVAKLKAAHVIP